MKRGDSWGGEMQHVLIEWSGKTNIWAEAMDWEAKGKLEEEEFRKGEKNVTGPEVGERNWHIQGTERPVWLGYSEEKSSTRQARNQIM